MNATPYTILLYHGVVEDRYDDRLRNSSGKHVWASDFERQMDYVRTHHPVVTMRELADAHRGTTMIEPGSVAVTFDDGYLNNLRTAWPILRRLSIPITIYLTTGFIGTQRLMWSDALEERILSETRDQIEVELLGQRRSFSTETADAKIATFYALKKACKQLTWEERLDVLGALEVETEMKEDSPFWSWLTWEDVRTLDRSELISFGAHTVDHVSLGRVSADMMRDQVDLSLQHVSEATKTPCRLFAYPEGREGDFNQLVIAHLQSRGLNHAPTAIPGINIVEQTPPFEMRRIMVGFEDQPFPIRLLTSIEAPA